MSRKYIETKTSRIWLGKDGIVRIIKFPGSVTNLEEARQDVIATKKFGKKKRPRFVDISKIESVTKEAREYYASEDASRKTSAMALLVGSPVSKVIGNFYLGIDKPPYPIKLFITEEKAIQWLKQFVA